MKRDAVLCAAAWLAAGGLAFAGMKAGPDGSEDWSRLRIDMGKPEKARDGFTGTPLGNGIFSAKENAGVGLDIFQLNHSTFWWGDPALRDAAWNGEIAYKNSQATRRENYDKLRQTLREAYRQGIDPGRRAELLKTVPGLTKKIWNGGAGEQSGFLPLGTMDLSFPGLEEGVTEYRRTLDLDRAVSEVRFKKDGANYLRETFISNPDRVMATRITNDRGRPMSLSVAMAFTQDRIYHPERYPGNRIRVDAGKNEVVKTGRAPYHGLKEWDDARGTLFEARVKVVVPEGRGPAPFVRGGAVAVTNASEILLYYSCDTSFKDSFTDPSRSGVDYAGNVRRRIDAAAALGWDRLLARHLAEYRPIFRSFWLDMDGEPVKCGWSRVTPFEFARHYQYARYVSICCERRDSFFPHNLVGIWLNRCGYNQGSFFLNENVEKMAALNGPANLAAVSDGLHNLVDIWDNDATGRKTASVTYGAEKGAWVVSHSTGAWGQTGLYGGNPAYGSWLAGGMWVLDCLYDKYDFTRDLSQLRRCYPHLEGAARFALSTLTRVDGVKGELKPWLVIAPSGSPEHWYNVGKTGVSFDIGTACDVEIYQNLFNMLIEGSEALAEAGIPFDESLVRRVREARSKLVPLDLFINEDGLLREWYNEYPVGQKNHRHGSHLLGLYLNHLPYNRADTPKVFAALRAEAQRWGRCSMGAHPDRSTIMLRAGDPDFAISHITHGVVMTCAHENVMHWTPVAASVAEALLDSRFHRLNLLENLPAAWKGGTVRGIRGRGGYALSIDWKDGRLSRCAIDSPTGETPVVLCKGAGVDLSSDGRFTVSRAPRPPAALKAEAEKKLAGRYGKFTEKSASALRAALRSGDAARISSALLGLVPQF